MQKYTEKEMVALLQKRYDSYLENRFDFLIEKSKDKEILELYNKFIDVSKNKDEFQKLIDTDYVRNYFNIEDIRLISENDTDRHFIELLWKWEKACEECNVNFEKCLNNIERRVKLMDEYEIGKRIIELEKRNDELEEVVRKITKEEIDKEIKKFKKELSDKLNLR